MEKKITRKCARAVKTFQKQVKLVHLTKLFNTLRTKFVQKNEYKWVFGSWLGTQMGDNPYALLRQILKYKKESGDPFWQKLDIVWSCNTIPEEKIEGVRYVNRSTKEAMKEAATARVHVFCQWECDITNDIIYLGYSYKVNLWHGVAWKRIGFDENSYKEESPENLFFSKIRRALHNFLYPEKEGEMLCIAPSDRQYNIIQSAWRVPDNVILKVGQPRNEMFFDKDRVSRCREKILSRLSGEFGVKASADMKIIAYMPTFRDFDDYVFSFLKEDLGSDFYRYLEDNHIVIAEKNHFVTIVKNKLDDCKCPKSPNIVKIAKVDTQEFLAAADMLITDYSSCYFDYLLLDRPIIHYLYDYDSYNTVRGLYYPIDDAAGGTVAYDAEHLLSAIRENIKNPGLEAKTREKRRQQFDTYESPDNSKKILERIRHDVYGK